MSKYTYANWCLSNNVGDLLTSYIIEKLSNTKCIYALPNSDTPKYMVIGTILNWDIKNTITWGTGIGNRYDYIQSKPIKSVRGNISLTRMRECGISTEGVSVGDPALILPFIYKKTVEKTTDVAIIPHYVDLEYVIKKYSDTYKIINPLDTVENVIDQILECKSIISSSLHGLVISEAYSIPTQWVKFSDNLGGDGTKFLDHYSALNTTSNCIDLRTNDISTVSCTYKKINDNIIKNMINTCPFITDDIKKGIL